MSDHSSARQLVGLAVMLVIASVVLVGCSAPPRTPERAGPDARVSRLPDSAQGSRWPSDDLRFVVAQPSYDQSPRGTDQSIDLRTTLAVVDPDRAVWVMDARMDDTEGLELSGMLEQLIVLDTLAAHDGEAAIPLKVDLKVQPGDDLDRMVLAGGRWRVQQVRTPTDSAPHTMITLAIVDDRGKPAGEAVMSLLTARDLLIRLDGGIRATRH